MMSSSISSPASRPQRKAERQRNIPQRAWEDAISTLSTEDREGLATALQTHTFEAVNISLSYLKYDNIVILQAKSLQKPPLSKVLEAQNLKALVPRLWESLAKAFSVSHVGVTAPIPLHVDSRREAEGENNDVNGSNILRSPTSFQPLYGGFGDASKPFSDVTVSETFWASATQHGITQVWSPLHTMFSNGNISEKARVRDFQRLQPSTAIDLYAGIGYFSLFYRKHVADLVLGWEINPWSVEGFRRGAEANGKGTETLVVRGRGSSVGEQLDLSLKKHKILGMHAEHMNGTMIFEYSNELAVEHVEALRRVKSIPPIRHINCGYLPTSLPSWNTAVRLLLSDSRRCAGQEEHGRETFGWVHAHENIATQDIEARATEVVSIFQGLSERRVAEMQGDDYSVHVSCAHVARVKTYAPGVYHCVLDILIECKPRIPC